MGGDILLVYLIALVVLTVIVAVILVWVLTSAAKKRQEELVGPPAEKEASKLVLSSPSPLAPAEPLVAVGDTEVMRVMRDKTTGALYIEVEGRAYRSLTDIRSPEVGRSILQAVADLVRFTKYVTPAVPRSAAQPSTGLNPPLAGPSAPAAPSGLAAGPRLAGRESGQSPLPPTPSVPAPGSLARRGEALIKPSTGKLSPTQPPQAPEPAPPPSRLLERTLKSAEGSTGEKPGTGPLRKTGPLGKPKTGPLGKPPTGPLGKAGGLSLPDERAAAGPIFASSKETKPNIDLRSFWERALLASPSTPSRGPRPLADQLEEVLQHYIHSLPQPPPNEIHFRTAADGSLAIEVGGVAYSNIDDIQDPTARELVQIAIRKWEGAG